MPDAVAAMRDAFVRVAQRDVDDPPRIALSDGSALAMMARGDATSGTVVKLVSVRSHNRERGLPNIHALAAWLDGPTGQPLFLIDGTALTSLRTGAASGAAADVLAASEARVLAMIGAGGQAADQIRGVCAVRQIAEVRIVSRTISSATLAESLRAEMPDINIRAVPRINDALADADVVCCATNAREPILSARMLNGRVHVNAIGSYRPDMRELAGDVLEEASIVAVDDVRAAMIEAGEIIHAVSSGSISEHSLTELGRLLLHPPDNIEAITVFKSVGIAVQDWAIARLVSEQLCQDAAIENGRTSRDRLSEIGIEVGGRDA